MQQTQQLLTWKCEFCGQENNIYSGDCFLCGASSLSDALPGSDTAIKSQCGHNGTQTQVFHVADMQGWTALILDKEQDLSPIGGDLPITGFKRKDVANEMRLRGIPDNKVFSFETCCRHSVKYYCPNDGQESFVPYKCRSRICNLCADERKSKFRREYGKKMQKMRYPVLLTATLEADIAILYPEVFTYYRQMFHTLMKRISDVVVSGISVAEFSSDFKLHFHAVIDIGQFRPEWQAELSEEWEDITGNSYIIDIRKVSAKFGFNYIMKYVSKTPEFLCPEFYVSYFQITKGRRLYSAIGTFYNNQVKCPKCGKNNAASRKKCSECGAELRQKRKVLCPVCGLPMLYSNRLFIVHDFMLSIFGEESKIP
jgi:hypothetical protein